ncbi:MAG: DUF4870 domain-containing protein [Streptosporangiales bacterium]|nr:DUF4870 domain-containing protein [Streptosporangiales bacterium]
MTESQPPREADEPTAPEADEPVFRFDALGVQMEPGGRADTGPPPFERPERPRRRSFEPAEVPPDPPRSPPASRVEPPAPAEPIPWAEPPPRYAPPVSVQPSWADPSQPYGRAEPPQQAPWAEPPQQAPWTEPPPPQPAPWTEPPPPQPAPWAEPPQQAPWAEPPQPAPWVEARQQAPPAGPESPTPWDEPEPQPPWAQPRQPQPPWAEPPQQAPLAPVAEPPPDWMPLAEPYDEPPERALAEAPRPGTARRRREVSTPVRSPGTRRNRAQPSPLGDLADVRTVALVCHLGGLVVGFLAPLVVFLRYRHRSSFLRVHSVEALNFQLVLAVLYAAGALLLLTVVGVYVLVATWLLSLVLGIQASLAANGGHEYHYPVTLHFVR